MPTISKMLQKHARTKQRDPLWEGPESSGPNGGVTQSLIKRFTTCRERFRLYAIEGLKPVEDWNHRTGYGDMWHVAEEALAAKKDWQAALHTYVDGLCAKHRLRQEEIVHWYSVCKTQFPHYTNWWKKHPDVIQRKPLFQEKEFNVPYELPSGRKVYLKGKFDSVDLIGKQGKVILKENKTKGDINEQQIKRQLQYDLQCMFYLVALKSVLEGEGQKNLHIAGVNYNVVRRPLSGGKGTIKRKEGKAPKMLKSGRMSKGARAETAEEFYQRLSGIIEKNGEHFFMRWTAEVSPMDLANFRRECLDPILEQMCDWWEWIQMCQGDPWRKDLQEEFADGSLKPYSIHWRHPYGCENAIDTWGSSDVDEYLNTRSEVGLRRVSSLFPELNGGA